MAASYFPFLTHTVSGGRRKCTIQTQSKAHLTWMILESSSKEFLQSPQYSWANWSMYLFTLAEVELIPPLLPDSSWNRGENKKEIAYRGSTQNQLLQNSIRGQHSPLPLAVIKASVPPAWASGQDPSVPCYLWLFRSCLVHFTQQVFQLRSVSHELVIHSVSLVQESVDICYSLRKTKQKKLLFYVQTLPPSIPWLSVVKH